VGVTSHFEDASGQGAGVREASKVSPIPQQNCGCPKSLRARVSQRPLGMREASRRPLGGPGSVRGAPWDLLERSAGPPDKTSGTVQRLLAKSEHTSNSCTPHTSSTCTPPTVKPSCSCIELAPRAEHFEDTLGDICKRITLLVSRRKALNLLPLREHLNFSDRALSGL
jgi:hypothetical protein